MTLMDYTWDQAETAPSVDFEHTSWGYRLSEVEKKGTHYHIARVLFAGLTFGLIAAGGMVWTLADTNFPGDPSLARAVLSSAFYIVAAALVVNGAFLPHRDVLEIDVRGRVLSLISHNRSGWRKTRRTIRFEEITRIDLAETSLISELKSALTNWDYGRITMTVAGHRPVHMVGGDMAELEPLLSRLRSDAGVV